MAQEGKYGWVTDGMFEEKVQEIAHRDGVMDVPGVYELVREELNNQVLKELEEEHPDKVIEWAWAAFVASFKDKLLEPQVVLDDWFEVELDDGNAIYPASDFSEEGVFDLHQDVITRNEVERLNQKWGARLSAPGYLDCTEWCLLDSQEEAREYLMENYDDDDE